MIEIYTDGSATKKRSGWGFVALVNGTKVYERAGVEQQGDTNQRMEIIAVMEACDWAANSDYIKDHDVTIYSDSAYVINCFKDKWFINWENNGWKNAKGETIANLLEWRFLIKFFKMPNFNFEKVKGHAGNLHNERADTLAQGKDAPTQDIENLTNNKKYDKIYIEISEILLNYKVTRSNINHTINSIIDIMKREGLNFDDD